MTYEHQDSVDGMLTGADTYLFYTVARHIIPLCFINAIHLTIIVHISCTRSNENQHGTINEMHVVQELETCLIKEHHIKY